MVMFVQLLKLKILLSSLAWVSFFPSAAPLLCWTLPLLNLFLRSSLGLGPLANLLLDLRWWEIILSATALPPILLGLFPSVFEVAGANIILFNADHKFMHRSIVPELFFLPCVLVSVSFSLAINSGGAKRIKNKM